MRKSVCLVGFIVVTFMGSTLHGQWSTAAHSLRDATTILTVVYKDSGSEKTITGTAFFAAMEDSRLTNGLSFGYLVTNRHMAAPATNGVPAPIIREQIKLNLAQPNDAQSDELTLPLTGAPAWFFPADPSVDLAVMPMAPSPKTFAYRGIPSSAFATRDVIKSDGITEGDDVILAGFFYPFSGKQKIQPLVRHGIVAMLPDEKVPGTMGAGKLYLIDLHILHGNSGSPVMVCKGSPTPKEIIVIGSGCRLLGVVSGYFYEDEELELRATTPLSGRGKANSGVSAVVPVDELLDLLNTPTLRTLRESQIKALPR